MEDSELTRKAIEELMREMNDFEEKESLPTERKKNPLGKPNKRFLGRTINSIMTHNKRQNDRNHQRCQRKLKELDAKQRKREFRNQRRGDSRSQSSYEIYSSDSKDVDDEHSQKKRKKLKKKKRKKKKSSSSSSSSGSSSDTEYSSSSDSSVQSRYKNRKKKKHRKPIQKDELVEEFFSDYGGNETGMCYYLDPNLAYAAMAYSQMNHMLQQQQIEQQQMVKEELEESIKIPSDLCLSDYSESSLNISLNSSSAEEDENGILTFKLSSEDEEKVFNQNNTDKNVTKTYKHMEGHIDNEDKESVQSIISLESKASQRAPLKESDEVYLLSSSESEDLEIVETIGENINNPLDVKKKSLEEQLIVENFQTSDVITNTCAENYETDQKASNMDESAPNQSKEKTTKITVVDLTDE